MISGLGLDVGTIGELITAKALNGVHSGKPSRSPGPVDVYHSNEGDLEVKTNAGRPKAGFGPITPLSIESADAAVLLRFDDSLRQITAVYLIPKANFTDLTPVPNGSPHQSNRWGGRNPKASEVRPFERPDLIPVFQVALKEVRREIAEDLLGSD